MRMVALFVGSYDDYARIRAAKYVFQKSLVFIELKCGLRSFN
jgi:hypothetical protein